MEGVGSTRDELDGYDMRKSMPKDKNGEYVRENGKEVLVTPAEVSALYHSSLHCIVQTAVRQWRLSSKTHR